MAIITITPQRQERFKEALLKYLNGIATLEETRSAFKSACTESNHITMSAKALATSIPLGEQSSRTLDPLIAQIFEHLNMPTSKPAHASTTNLYDALRYQNECDLDYLLEDLIDEVQPSVPWLTYMYTPVLLAVSVLGLSYAEPEYFWALVDWISDILPVVAHWLNHYLVQLNNWPLIGMGMQITWLLYYLRDTFRHGYDPSKSRVRNLSYRALALTFTFLGHLLTFYAAGTLAWGAACLFFASSCVGIIESIHFYVTQKARSNINQPEEEHPHEKAWEIRDDNIKNRNYYYFLVRLIYSLAVTALLVICTLLPSSLILTITYTLAFSLAFLIRDYCIERIKHSWAEKEQDAVIKHYQSMHSDEEYVIQQAKKSFRMHAGSILDAYPADSDNRKIFSYLMEHILKAAKFDYSTAEETFDCAVEAAERTSSQPNTLILSQLKSGFYYAPKPAGRTPVRHNLLSSAHSSIGPR